MARGAGDGGGQGQDAAQLEARYRADQCQRFALMRMSEPAPAKLNLALHVRGKLPDGRHSLETLFAFCTDGDRVEGELADDVTLDVAGPFAEALRGDNLVLTAAFALREAAGVGQGASLRLVKNLPVASGIGGGSADAAAMLRGLLRLTHQELTDPEVIGLAKNLGADVPVCFREIACHMQGIGEIITPLPVELPRAIVLINPLHPCSTASVFNHLAMRPGQSHLAPLALASPHDWRNDMTDAALATQPIIAHVLAALMSEPAFTTVRMSGSGATCFGLVPSMAQASAAAARLSIKNPNWWVRAATLS